MILDFLKFVLSEDVVSTLMTNNIELFSTFMFLLTIFFLMLMFSIVRAIFSFGGKF